MRTDQQRLNDLACKTLERDMHHGNCELANKAQQNIRKLAEGVLAFELVRHYAQRQLAFTCRNRRYS